METSSRLAEGNMAAGTVMSCAGISSRTSTTNHRAYRSRALMFRPRAKRRRRTTAMSRQEVSAQDTVIVPSPPPP